MQNRVKSDTQNCVEAELLDAQKQEKGLIDRLLGEPIPEAITGNDKAGRKGIAGEKGDGSDVVVIDSK